jgi:sterol desaturase/sphingolipid hydroxylase (fatty acid hydroxylase superfamily)
MFPTLGELGVWFVVLALVFGCIERRRVAARRLPLLRRGFATDFVYWIMLPLTSRVVTVLSVGVGVVPVVFLVHGSMEPSVIEAGFGPLSRWPLWQQAVAILILGDFLGYWMHRLFHRGRLWRLHAIHHSSTDLDWLSSVRVHPLNDVLTRIVSTVPVLALGFAPLAVAAAIPWLTLMAFVLHSNVDWDWGPLRRVIASPRFHRWHHSDEIAARDKNFAGLLPLWDILFGTYHMPRDRVATTFGTEERVPDGVLGQMMFPFRKP